MCLFLYQHDVQLLIYEKKLSYIVCRGLFLFHVVSKGVDYLFFSSSWY